MAEWKVLTIATFTLWVSQVTNPKKNMFTIGLGTQKTCVLKKLLTSTKYQYDKS